MEYLVELGLAALVMAMAFAVGFAIRRGSICMVAASRMLVVDGRPMRLKAFALAGAISALAIIPLSWATGDPGMLSPTYGIGTYGISPYGVGASMMLAGCGFGVGAMINGGCAFGTLARLSGGQTEYLASVAATVAGAMLAMPKFVIGPQGPGTFAEPGWAGAVMLLASAALVWPALTRSNWRNLVSAFRRKTTLLRPTTAMLVIGLLSGLLFALAGSWSHLAVLGQEGDALIGEGMAAGNAKAIVAALALVSGALFAAIRSGRFKLKWPTALGLLRRTLGGGIMGYSAAMIPGGNGALLTYGLPSGAASAWAAFACMVLTLMVMFVPVRLMEQRSKLAGELAA